MKVFEVFGAAILEAVDLFLLPFPSDADFARFLFHSIFVVSLSYRHCLSLGKRYVFL